MGKELTMSSLFVVLFTLVLIASPNVILWGWVRWLRRSQPLSLMASLSLAGLALATASAVLAITSVLYARAVGGFPFFDPSLLRIYRWGAMLSLLGIGLAVIGVWKPNPVRWHALACAAGTLVFWIVAAEGE